MYKTKYVIYFKSVDNQLYRVEIKEENYNGEITELTGGVPTFTFDYNSNSDFLYNPLRFSGGTLKVVGNSYLQDLFTTNYQQYKINLYKNTDVMWSGFIVPELYTQENSGYIFELEIECISALSVLEFIKFEKTTDTISLMELLKNAIEKSKGEFNNIYLPMTYTNAVTDNSNILNRLLISSSNFIDEEGEGMSYKDILSEICKFLGWTLIEKNGSIYFLDIDYLTHNETVRKFVFHNSLNNMSISTGQRYDFNFNNLKSKGIDNQLSILGGYNKVSVINSDYEVSSDDLFPQLNLNLNDLLSTTYKNDNEKKYIKEYYASNLTFYNYKVANKQYVPHTQPFDNINNQAAGAVAIRRTEYELENEPSKLTWENAIELKQYSNIGDSTKPDLFIYQYPIETIIKNYPLINSLSDTVVVIDNNMRLSINFSFQIVRTQDGFVDEYNPQFGSDMSWVQIYIPARLKIGDHYYNGSTWTTDPNNFFKIYTSVSKNNWFNVWLNVKNTNTLTAGTEDLSGYIVNFDKSLIGKIELTLYNPIHPMGELILFGVPTSFFIKDLKMNSQRIDFNRDLKTDEKKDTIYSNVVNDKFINEADDIVFRITSANQSQLSNSKVLIDNRIVSELTNQITKTATKPEKLMIQRVINQYQQPKLKLTNIVENKDLTPDQLFIDPINYPDKKFIISNENIDYYHNTNELTLIEVN